MHAVRSKKKDETSSTDNQVGTQRRRKINPLSPPTTLKLNGISIHFPFRPYDCQKDYMQTVLNALLKSENALLESPTGTGKTLCLLCATLAWQRQERVLLQQASSALPNASQSQQQQQQSRRVVPTIIYASRTHSQLAQVVRELRATRYRPTHAVLGSREHMCVHPKVKTTNNNATATDINNGCNQLGKERKCRFRNQLEHFSIGTTTSTTTENNGSGSSCQQQQQPLLDMEELVALGKSKGICPFYYSRGALENNAEVVFVPYNYLFDTDARTSTLDTVPWENAVVIFDEAHNLESCASESASFTLSSIDIAGCIGDVTRAMHTVQSMGGGGGENSGGGLKLDRLVKIKEILLSLEQYLMNLGPQTAFAGNYMFDFLRAGCRVTHANHDLLIQEIKRVTDWLADLRGNRKGSARLEHFIQCLKRVFSHSLESRCIAQSAFYRVHVSPKPPPNSNTGRSISYWCFAPSLAMEELTNLRVRSILVTSGTLSPLPSYQMELGIPFPHTLENPHIIANHQIHTRVIGNGPTGKRLTSSYERRQDAEYFSELGAALLGVARVTPAGMLIFFPSYGVMESCLAAWGGPATRKQHQQPYEKKNNFFAARAKANNNNKKKTPSFAFPRAHAHFTPVTTGKSNIWQRMLAIKAVVLEPKSSAELPEAMGEFTRFLGMPKSSGCILMGVCRGKISEGIDFANEQCRAVVITGLPFPPAFDPKVKMKREYLDTSRSSGRSKPSSNGGFGGGSSSSAQHCSNNILSGHEWYTQQAHRAVNQAIGRVIRNRNDYGAVLLMDNRYGQLANQNGLSKWLRPHIQPDQGFGTMVRTLAQFYRTAKAETTSIVETEKKQLAATNPSTEDDEDEAPENDLSRIVLVRKRNVNPQTDVEASSFLPKDDVVARMDMQELQETKPSATATATTTAVEPAPIRGNSAVFAAKSKPSSSKAIATQFMDRIREKFDESHQKTIRKSILSMKIAGDKKDTSGYEKRALTVMTLVEQGERFEDCDDAGSKLLLLFFQLLPERHRKTLELRGLALVLDRSRLGEALKAKVKPNQWTMLQSTTAKLLQTLWCRSSDVPVPRDAYLRDCQPMVEAIVKLLSNARERMSDFTKLVPRAYRSYTFALFDELEAAKNMQRMKATDQSAKNSNDDGLNLRNPYAKKQIKTKPEAAKRAAIVPNDTSQPRKKQVVNNPYTNPYSRKSLVAPIATDTTTPVEQKTKPQPPRPVSTVASLLQHVESDVYHKPTPRNIARSLKASAPRNIPCPVCNESSCKEPFVADCGHVACLGCWLAWLQRSHTCMTCRVPTTKDQLARAVEQSTPGRIPTLSQLCGRDAEDDSDEDQLEIR